MAKPSLLFLSDVAAHQVLGGAERVLQEEVLGLKKRGYKISVLYRGKKNGVGFFQGIPLYSYAFFPHILSFWQCYVMYQKIKKKAKPDFLFGHQPLTSFIPFLVEKEIPKLYLYLSSWQKEIETRRKALPLEMFLSKWIESQVLRRAGKLLAISHHAKKEMVTLYPFLASKSIFVNWLGADPEKFKPLQEEEKRKKRKTLGLPPQRFLYLTVRNFVPRMGLENLISAFALLPENIKRASYLLLVGDGPLLGKLRQRVKEKKLEDFIRIEQLLPSQKFLPHSIMPLADCFVLPTKKLENFGLVIPESLACEVPVIGTPVGAIPEVLSSWNALFLCKSTKPEALAEKMAFVFKEKEKVPLWGKEGREFVLRKCTWGHHLERLETLFSQWSG